MKNISQSLIVIFFFVSQLIIAQNVGINSTAANPDNSAMLDIVSSNKGLLIPRVTLTSITDVSTIPNPAISLLVYNTAAAGIAPNNVIPGYYYYNGTAWVILTTGTFNDWKLAGNAGTTAGTDFIGTTDGQDVVFKRNNAEIARITQDGIGIGSTSPTVGVTSGAYLHFGNAANITSTSGLDIIIDNDNTSSTVNFRVRKDGATTLMQIQEDGTVSMGTSNTNPDVSAILDIKSNTRGVLLPRIALTSITDAATIPTPTTSLLVYNTNSSITNGNGVGYYYNSGTSASPNWVKLYASNAKPWETSGNAGTTAGTNFVGTTDAVDFVTKTNNTERMRILSTGNVGINTASPGSALDVKGTLRLSGSTSGYVGLATAATAGSTTYTLPTADGTAGQVLTTNGSGVLSFGSLGALLNIQTLTSGTLYTPTTGTTRALLILIGGGGGGGGAKADVTNWDGYSSVGGCGGGGGVVHAFINNISGTYAYAIGAAGTLGANTPANGGNGGNTTFTNGATTYTAGGGSGGASCILQNPSQASGGGGGTAANGLINIAGEPGDHGSVYLQNWGGGGFTKGGGTPFGNGGRAGICAYASTSVGAPGTGYGAGGGGGLSNSSNSGVAGAAGTAGAIIIYEYK